MVGSGLGEGKKKTSRDANLKEKQTKNKKQKKA